MTGAGNDGEHERFEFILPSFPVSFNRLYTVNYDQRRVTLSNEALLWKTRNAPYIKLHFWKDDGCPLKLTMDFASPRWLTKEGRLRRVDLQNLEKFAIDIMFEKWGWDDSRIVERITRKVYGMEQQVRVVLERVDTYIGKPRVRE